MVLGIPDTVQGFLNGLNADKGFLDRLSTDIKGAFTTLRKFSAILFQRIQISFAGNKKKIPLITSAKQIKKLIEHDTPLHVVWKAIKAKLALPNGGLTKEEIDEMNGLKTAEEISQWMQAHPTALATITDLDLAVFSSKGVRIMLPPEMDLLKLQWIAWPINWEVSFLAKEAFFLAKS